MSLYCEAVFQRGFGLGNRLFPWARARVFASANEIPMLAPRWVSPRIMPLFRKGAEIHTYPRQVLLVGQLRPKDGDVTGLTRSIVERSSEIRPEPSAFSARLVGDLRPGRHLIRFEGDLTGTGRFKAIEGHDVFIRSELRAIIRKRWLDVAERTRDTPIGIHVRLGDFRAGSTGSFRNKDGAFIGAMRTPLQWYVETLRIIRGALGSTWPAFVVSNGAPEEMEPLLQMEAVTFVRSQSPVSDMWSLANCRVLMASVGSCFSAWASFLGQMPTVVYPLREAHAFPIENRYGLYNGLFDPDRPDPAFLRSLEACK
jgi:hypothetical protein